MFSLVSVCRDTAQAFVFLLVSICRDTAQALVVFLVQCVVTQPKRWCCCWCQCVVTQPKPLCSCWCQFVVTQPKPLCSCWCQFVVTQPEGRDCVQSLVLAKKNKCEMLKCLILRRKIRITAQTCKSFFLVNRKMSKLKSNLWKYLKQNGQK